ELPSTGVGLSWERLLSPVFIRGDGYGTRSSTVVLIDTRGHVRFVERTWNPAGQLADERRFHLRLASPVTA
ncbi:MAG: NRDE family protein, partial [Burkholderiales bacterium]|nr:NRDE family protein [Burkholderiales bacterium]